MVTILEELRTPLPREKPRDREILLEWLGLASEDLPTLEEMGERRGLTRERVRQIRQRSLERSVKETRWVSRVEEVLAKALEGRERPLYLDLLAEYVPTLRGLEGRRGFWKRFTQDLSNELHVVGAPLGPVISRGDEASYVEARRLVGHEMDRYVGQALSGARVQALVEAVAYSKDLPEFTEEMEEYFERQAVFAPRALLPAHRSPARVFLGLRGSATRLIQRILELSPRPLHVSEMQALYGEASGEDVSETNVRSAVSAIGFPFGRSTYGLFKHLPMTPEARRSVAARVEEILLDDSRSRQWHAAEVLSQMLDEGIAIPEEVDYYALSVILHENSNLRYLGRSIWTVEEKGEDERRHLADIVVALLRREGQPMDTDEILEAAGAVRGIGPVVMLTSDGDLGRVGPGRWGLLSRDFYLCRTGIVSEVMDSLYGDLEQRQQALHRSELEDILAPRVPDDGDVESLTWEMLELARRDERFWVGRGQLVGLATWSSLRRYTTREAVIALADDWPRPLTIEEIRQLVGEMLDRPYAASSLYNLLPSLGISFDRESGTWAPTGVPEADDDE